MSTSPIRENISKLAKAMYETGLRKAARVIDCLVSNRSPVEHTKWNDHARKPVAEAVIESLETQASFEEELTPQAQKIVADIPEVEERIPGVKEKEPELVSMEETGGFKTYKDHVKSRQPADVLWSLVRLRSDDNVVKAFFSRRTALGIRDDKDWQTFKTSHLNPFLLAMRGAFGEAYSNIIWSLAAQASRLYRCGIEKLLPEDVYTRAFEFYTDCGIGQSVTFSTSSGLPNPLERHGTDWFLHRYDVDPNSEAVADLLLKNPFRTDNFLQGILNSKIHCERLYVWESRGSSRALKKAYEAVPKEKQDLFVSDAVAKLAECFALPQLRILEIPEFESWMTRLTRNSPNSIMISFRGPISKRISHAVNINFSKAKDIHQIYRLVFPIGAAASGAIYPGTGLGILWAVAIGLESIVYEEIKNRVFSRGFDWKNSRIEGVEEVKPFGIISESDIKRIAEVKIHQMLSAQP